MQQFRGKTIAIVGLSVEGQDSARFFTSRGAQVTCCDRRTRVELGPIYDALTPLGVSLRLGDAYLHGIEDFDLVVRSQGVALWLPEFAKLGAKLTSNTKLFFSLCPAPIIGVTGTKGKGTTSTLIYEMLLSHGLHAHIGGNVGKSLLSRIISIKKDDWVVLELSSFQLEDLTQSPHIAVVLRITQDHLANYDPLATNYHKSREIYVTAKQSIVRFQKESDIAILHADDPTSRSFAKYTSGIKKYISLMHQDVDGWVTANTVYVRTNRFPQKVCSSNEILLPGIHNLENIAAASVAAISAGVTLSSIQHVVRTFKGLPHRLETVRVVGGITYVDDSFSTVPETTIAAIRSYEKPMTLIVGGSEKGSDFTHMAEEIAKQQVVVLIVIGQMTKRILSAISQTNFRGNIITGCRTMGEIVHRATEVTPSEGVVLLSPGCASFDMFKNYKDRGEQFSHEVVRL